MMATLEIPPSVGSPHPGIPALVAALRASLSPATVIRENEPLARRTTLRVGGCADVLVEPAEESDLGQVLQQAARWQVPWRVLGRGSNVLVRDGGVRGVVICLTQPAFCGIEALPPRLVCGAGARLKDLANEARRHGVAGLEFLAGIPGSVGGALRMNAGAWNAMTFERLVDVRFLSPDGTVHQRPASQIPSAYRRCEWFRDHLALGATFEGEMSNRESIDRRMAELNERRWASQPAAPSAGCIFKNPSATPAGRLIDELGLKGARIGGASVSDVHGNFIVNDGTASAADVLALIEHLRVRAREARGIELETEVEILGEP